MRAFNDVYSHFIKHRGNTASCGAGYFLNSLFTAMEKVG